MIRLKNSLKTLCAVSLLSIVSCQENAVKHSGPGSTKTVNNRTGADKKYRFGLHLVKGEKYYYTVKTDIQTTLEVNDKTTESRNRSELAMIYEVIKDSANIFSIKITYDKLHIELKKTDTDDQVYDAANAVDSYDQMDKLLGDIKGSSIIVSLNGKADIVSVLGSKEIMDRILAPMAMESLEQKKKVQDLVSKLTGDGFIQDNLKEAFTIFPDTGMYVGDSWNRISTQAADMKLTVHSKYTLTSLADGIALVNVEGLVDNTKNAAVNFMGYDVTSELKGGQEGQFKADVATGLLLYGKTDISVKGEMQVMGKSIPIKFKVKKEITSKKL